MSQAVCKGLSTGDEAGILSHGNIEVSCVSDPVDAQAKCFLFSLTPCPGTAVSTRAWTDLAGRGLRQPSV